MENTPITLENVLDQAANWTFAGDYTLLQWMNKISQDLESRANKTTEALSKLDNNVRSTNIALDNVANSLTTLQFGNQFVESRVQDDETLSNANEAVTNKESYKNEATPSSKDMLNTFLENNLKILRNCHEKYSLDLDDSDDDEEGANEKTCIYQPINPYNDRPLPFIFGSKDWYAKWHVGLFENQQDNNYSGDEISETFSVSSDTPTDDNESFESNTEWTSSNSVDNNNYDANIKVRNASSLRGSQQQLMPDSQASKAINVIKPNITNSESSSISTTSSSLAKKPLNTQKPNEIKPTRADSINSINSNASNRDSIKTPGISKEKPLAYTRPAVPFMDLFAEPPEDIQSITSTISTSTQHTRRPSADLPTTTIPSSLPKSGANERPSLFSVSKPAPFVDLFSEPPEDVTSSTSSSLSSNRNIKRKPVNIFDDDNDDDDLLPQRPNNENIENLRKPTQTEKEERDKSKTIVEQKPKIIPTMPKSLFDENSDEDDDDFLKAFAKKSSSTKSPLTKTLLFDKDYDLISESPKKPLTTNLFEPDINPIKESKPKRVNIFDDIEDDEDENALFRNINKNKITNVLTNPTNDSKKVDELDEKMGKAHSSPTDNLFDDVEELKKKENEKIDSFVAAAKKKINLFDDLEDDDNDDDIFAVKTKPLKTDSYIKQTSLKQDQEAQSKQDQEVQSEIISTTPIANDSKSLKNEFNSQEILTKPNEAADKELNVKDNPFNENTQQMTEARSVHKTLAEISDSSKEKEGEAIADLETSKPGNTTERELAQKSDRVLDISQDQSNNSLPNIPKTAKRNESLPKPQVSLNKPPKVSLKDNINDKLNKELNNNLTATDSPKESEVSTINNESPTSNINEPSAIIDSETPSTAKTTEPSSAPMKYDFNSIIFLDEPPEDDNEFFEILSKTPKTLNTKYNSIDLEHDLYEPDLPKVPTTNQTINPVDSTNITQQPTLYTGLQLFSDVPPDDDDDENVNSNKIVSDSSLTKRLHSVFYDDFNETLAALNQKQDESISSPAVLTKKITSPFREDNKDSKVTTADMSKDIVDHKVEDAKGEGFKAENKKRPVSKLQMPNININVQALLPGANTTLRKAKESPKDMTDSVVTETVSHREELNVSKEKEVGSKTETKAVARTAETEHILPSVTKNRVRAPISRRPSTRKARQDNYRKSLMEQEEQQSSPTSNEAVDKSTYKKENIENGQQPAQVERVKEQEVPRGIAKLLDDATESPEDIFKKVKSPTKTILSQSSILKKESDDRKDTNVTKQPREVPSKQITTKEIKKPSSSTLFDDDLEDDSNPFSISQSPQSSGNAFKEKTTTSLLFDDNEDKDISSISQVPQHLPNDKIQTETLGKALEERKVPKPTSSLFFEDDDDEEDAFNFFKNTKTSKTKDSVGAIKKEEKPTLKEKAESIEKPKASLIFDDENEDDDDEDFFKRINSKDTNKKEVSKENLKIPNDSTKTSLEKETKKPTNSLLLEKEATDERSKSSEVAQKALAAEAEGPKNVSPANMTSNLTNLLPAKDSFNLSFEEQKQNPIPQQDSNNEQINETKNSGNFLDDDYDDYDDDTLFGTSRTTMNENTKKPARTFLDDHREYIQNQRIPTHSIRTMTASERKAKEKFVSFLDNDSDDDFTVAGLQAKKLSQAQTNKAASGSASTESTTSTKTSTQHKAKKSNSSKLFADSDTDSDDLFGKISPKKALSKPSNTSKVTTTNQVQLPPKNVKTSKPPTSLFSDDSDEDIDFLKPSGSNTKPVIPKSSVKENSSKVPAQSNANLFSDIDSDEDDLFGGAGVTKPTKASIISNVKTTATPAPVAKTLQTSKAKSSDDNPLADLL